MFEKRFSARRTVEAWVIGSILLISWPSFPAEQSVATKARTILEAGLRDNKADKRAQALSVLGLMPGDRKAIEAAEHALRDPDLNVRAAAIAALGEMDARASLPEIKALVSGADGKTVVAIAAVLAKFKDPEGYEIYYELLTGKRKSGGSILDGVKDKKYLEKMGVESAIGFIPFGGMANGAYEYFRQNGSARANLDVKAVTALAPDPDPAVEKALVQASFGGKDVVQVAALRALAHRGDPAVVDDIKPAMYSDKPLISYTAAATVLHLLEVRPRQPVKHRRRKELSEDSGGLNGESG